MITILISIIAILIGQYKASADHIQSTPSYREKECNNKYKLDEKGKPIPHGNRKYNRIHRLYIKLFAVKYQEAFLFSTSLLVWITDNWHLVNTIRHILSIIMVLLLTIGMTPMAIFAIIPAYLTGFHIANYKLINIK